MKFLKLKSTNFFIYLKINRNDSFYVKWMWQKIGRVMKNRACGILSDNKCRLKWFNILENEWVFCFLRNFGNGLSLISALSTIVLTLFKNYTQHSRTCLSLCTREQYNITVCHCIRYNERNAFCIWDLRLV